MRTGAAAGGEPPSACARAAASLDELYEAHARRIFGLCLSYLHNPADAEDATQETFVRAAQRLDRLTGEPAAYLTVVARSVCCDEVRRRTYRSTPSPVDVLPEGDGVWIDTEMVTRWDVRRLWARLSEPERALLAQDFAGYSYEEIGRRTGRSLKAVSAALSRARCHARELSAAGASLLALPEVFRRVARRLGPRADGAQTAMGSLAAAGLEPAGLVAATMLAILVVGSGAPATGDGVAPASPPAVAWHPPGSLHASESAPAAAGPVAVNAVSPSAQGVAGGPIDATPQGATVLVTGAAFPGAQAQQRDAEFNSITPSPRYSRDHTVFASGLLMTGCSRPIGCPVLFRSTDGGTTWTHLAAAGFQGGEIVLPPSFPLDPIIFASTPVGLQRSDDSGATFVLVVPAAGPVAVSPDSAPGDATLVIGSQPMWIYHARARAMIPGPRLPTDVTTPDAIRFDGDSRHIVAAATRPDTANPSLQDGVIVHCDPAAGCRVVDVSSDAPPLMLVASPTVASDHTLVAYSARHLSVSHDGGATFRHAASSNWGALTHVALSGDYASNHEVLAGVRSIDPSGSVEGALVALVDRGNSLAVTAVRPLAAHAVLDALLALPDGRLLGAFASTGTGSQFGIHCSTDTGATWRDAC